MKIQSLPIPAGREGVASSEKSGNSGSGKVFAGTLAELFKGEAGELGARALDTANEKGGDRASTHADAMPTRAGVKGKTKENDKGDAIDAASKTATTGDREPEVEATDESASMMPRPDGPNAEARLQWLLGHGWHKGHESAPQGPKVGLPSTDADEILKLMGSGAGIDDTALAKADLPDEALAIARMTSGSGKAVPSEAVEPVTSRVRLDVLHMETHFEPVSGQAVLVEGDAVSRLPVRGSSLEAALGALLRRQPTSEAQPDEGLAEDRPVETTARRRPEPSDNRKEAVRSIDMHTPRGDVAASRPGAFDGAERARLPNAAIQPAVERSVGQPSVQAHGIALRSAAERSGSQSTSVQASNPVTHSAAEPSPSQPSVQAQDTMLRGTSERSTTRSGVQAPDTMTRSAAERLPSQPSVEAQDTALQGTSERSATRSSVEAPDAMTRSTPERSPNQPSVQTQDTRLQATSERSAIPSSVEAPDVATRSAPERSPKHQSVEAQDTALQGTSERSATRSSVEAPDVVTRSAPERSPNHPSVQVQNTRLEGTSERSATRSSVEAPDVVVRSAPERLPNQPSVQTSGSGIASAGLSVSLSGQVAERIVEAFAPETRAVGAGANPTANEALLRMRAGGAALKTLTLRLQPETLGILNVSMRLVDGELTLELAASQSETAKLLTEDKANLRTILEKAGFNLEDASIRVVARDLNTAGTPRGSEGGTLGQGGAGDGAGRQTGPNGQSGQDARGQGGHHPQERGSQERGARPDPAPAGASSRHAGGSIYL